MTLTIASSRKHTTISYSEAIAAAFASRLRLLERPSAGAASRSMPHQDAAIAILRDASSSSDLREWAERYLCGLTTADAATYGARHRSQA